MESVTIKAIVRELRPRCVPGRVQAVLQSSPRDVVVQLRSGRNFPVVLSAHPQRSSLHLAVKKPVALAAPTTLCRLLRKHLVGLVLTDLVSPGLERSVVLRFSRVAGGKTVYTLTAELMGRWSNLVLVDDATGCIVDCLHHDVPESEGKRTMAPGETYRPPPAGGRVPIDTVDRETFVGHYRRWKAGEISIFAPFVGLGPGLLALAAVSDGAGEGGEALFSSLQSVLDRVREGELEPVYYPGRRRLLPFRVSTWEDEPHQLFPTMSAAADFVFHETATADERQRLLSRARRLLARRVRRAAEKERRLIKEKNEAVRVSELEKIGRRLLASLADIPRGASSFVLPGTGGSDEAPFEVQLNPALGPRRNAESYFRKAKKMRRRVELAGPKLISARREREEAERMIDEVERLSDEELKELVCPAPTEGAASRKGRRPTARVHSLVRVYRDDGGWRILVGKSSRGNDYLTSRIAAPEDYWFHARDYPGAHVVLKHDSAGAEPPSGVLESAAEAAAWHSAARGEGRVDVSFTRRKYVRKVKGQPAGSVLVPEAGTIRARPRLPAGFREVKAVVK
jgi:predicted ribosome quality control (RQC) complex YloA/Tae2 family protein